MNKLRLSNILKLISGFILILLSGTLLISSTQQQQRVITGSRASCGDFCATVATQCSAGATCNPNLNGYCEILQDPVQCTPQGPQTHFMACLPRDPNHPNQDYVWQDASDGPAHCCFGGVCPGVPTATPVNPSGIACQHRDPFTADFIANRPLIHTAQLNEGLTCHVDAQSGNCRSICQGLTVHGSCDFAGGQSCNMGSLSCECNGTENGHLGYTASCIYTRNGAPQTLDPDRTSFQASNSNNEIFHVTLPDLPVETPTTTPVSETPTGTPTGILSQTPTNTPTNSPTPAPHQCGTAGCDDNINRCQTGLICVPTSNGSFCALPQYATQCVFYAPQGCCSPLPSGTPTNTPTPSQIQTTPSPTSTQITPTPTIAYGNCTPGVDCFCTRGSDCNCRPGQTNCLSNLCRLGTNGPGTCARPQGWVNGDPYECLDCGSPSTPTPGIPSPTPTAAPQTCVVSGQVLNIEVDHPAQCPVAGGYPGDRYNGIDDIRVDLIGTAPNGQAININTITHIGGSNQHGAFYLTNVPLGGTYNVCVHALPTGYANLCNIYRDDGHDPFGTTCAKVNTNLHCAGLRLDLNYIIMPSTTPRPTYTTTPSPTRVPGATNTPVPPPGATNTPLPAPSCGEQCSSSNPCQQGFICIKTSPLYSYCVMPVNEHNPSCYNNPSVGTCCTQPTNTPVPPPAPICGQQCSLTDDKCQQGLVCVKSYNGSNYCVMPANQNNPNCLSNPSKSSCCYAPTATPTQQPTLTPTLIPTAIARSCGYSPCTDDTSCMSGLICLEATDRRKYCIMPQYQNNCYYNPGTAACCYAPTATPTQQPVVTSVVIVQQYPTDTPRIIYIPNIPTVLPGYPTNTPIPGVTYMAQYPINTPVQKVISSRAPTIPTVGNALPFVAVLIPIGVLLLGLLL